MTVESADTRRRLDEAAALHRQGRLALAEVLYRDVLRTQPEHAQALGMLGLVEAAKGHRELAIELLERALNSQPSNAAMQFNLGLLLQEAGEHEGALVRFDRAVGLNASVAALFNARGVSLKNLGRHEDALADYGRAIALQSNLVEAWHNRGIALHRLERFADAAQSFEEALRLRPGAAATLNALGVALYAGKLFDESLGALDSALALEPGSPDVLLNRGNTLMELNRPDEALADWQRVALEWPRDPDVRMNIGNALRDLHRYAEAISHYEEAIELDPANAHTHWNFALCLLAAGEWERGWREFEWRLRVPSMVARASSHAPRWDGESSLHGATILVTAEQGLGDTIQFARFAGRLAERAAKVLMEMPKPLAPTMRTMPGIECVVVQGDALPSHDLQIPVMSLPLALGVVQTSAADCAPYLFADPSRVERWRSVVCSAPGPRIGIAWSGNVAYRGDHRRSMTLSTLLRALPPSCTAWCLQKDFSDADASTLAANPHVRRFDENDFIDTAAQMTAMDAIVSVDTSIAHLAGALGLPTLLLLALNCDWRWGWPQDRSPWYSQHRLFRQATQGDWAPALAAVKLVLEQLPQRARNVSP